MANELFSEYVVERLQVCICSVSAIILLRTPNHSQEVSVISARYSPLLAELIECLQSICGDWEAYLDQCHQRPTNTSYMAPVVCQNHAGRPKLLSTNLNILGP